MRLCAMNKPSFRSAVALLIASSLSAVAEEARMPQAPLPTAQQLAAATARFAPVDVSADLSGLPPTERQALAEILHAARLMDGLFLRQVWAGNDTLLESLAREEVTAHTPLARERLHAFI